MRDSRVTRRLGMLLVGALLLAPGPSWAVEEDVKESDSKAPAAQKDEKKKEPEAAQTAESDKGVSATIDVNTLEDIVAFRGSLASLWAGQPIAREGAPITWREVVPSERPGSTTVR